MQPTRFPTVWVLLLLVFLSPALGLTAEPTTPHVAQFTPQGTVKGVRQVSARFSEPMIPLGDPRTVVDPFEITCPEPGTSRWVDSHNWVYDFTRDLPGGLCCTFRLRAGLKSLAGKPVLSTVEGAIAGQQEFVFSTGGPAIQSHRPYERIEEDQVFVLILDAEPAEASVLEHVSFSVQGIPERIGIRLLTGEERQAILRTLSPWELPPGAPVVLLQARQRFPNKAKVSLVWGAGITSTSGVATDQDQVLAFEVREAFTADFHCQRENPEAACLPVTSMRINFSAPVPAEQARQVVLTGPGAQRWSPAQQGEETQFVSSVSFQGPFPEESTFRVEILRELKDESDRPLLNADKFPLTVKTGPFPPLAKFSARFGIVESKADPTLPVTLRNLEPEVQSKILRLGKAPPSGAAEHVQELWTQVQAHLWRIPPQRPEEILPWLRKVAVAKRDASVFDPPVGARHAVPLPRDAENHPVKTFALPKPQGAQAFEVVGIPLESPGLYIVELESARLGAALLGKPQPMYVPTAALVTNLAVHFKWGRDASLIWVTTLDEARPVPGAWVAVQDCQGTVLWKGETDKQGMARVGPLPAEGALQRCSWPDAAFDNFYDFLQIQALRFLSGGLFITAQTASDVSFVHSSWNDGIESWRFEVPEENYAGPVVAHTVFDRSLFRAGETVHMKHLLRVQTLLGFSPASIEERPTLVSIRHTGSDEKYEFPVQWQGAGVAENTWPIPKEAKLGLYQVVLTRPQVKSELVGPIRSEAETRELVLEEREWTSGEFRVEEFRVPLMKGTIQPPADPQIAVTEIPVDLSVQYLAGGGAGNLPVILRAQVRPREAPPFELFQSFVFANGVVKEGMTRRSPYGEGEEGGPTDAAGKPAVHQRTELQLDATGTARTAITNLPKTGAVQEVLTELEFRDPNGEVQTVAATTPLWPAKWLVGIKPDSWTASQENLTARVAVTDITGRPVAGAAVQVDLLERKNYSHRKRLVGGFYAYEHVEEVRRVGELCRGKTNAKGILPCAGKSPVDGNLVLQASLTDDAGNTTATYGEVWVVGAQRWWFQTQDSDRIDLLAERPRYEPGETARLQVRMPFPAATALVAVEREGGVLEAFVVPLAGNEPVIEVPIKDYYAPNVFISALVVRGRVSEVQPTALVDLGKPAFKLGIAEVRVGWRTHELKVTVTPNQEVYRVREKAAVKIAARTADGTPLPPNSEVAVAAVDEGLLELLPNKSWNLLEAMMGRRSYGVENATAQMQVVGKRHYGRKALPQGGGGGRQNTRELFDTLLLWQGRVALDARGEASVEVPLNDSLTSFRIVAVATVGVDQFGTGSTTIRSTQDLMVLPGIAPLARAGDQFRAEVTVRNTTNRVMDVVVKGWIRGLTGGGVEMMEMSLASQPVQLSPGEAKASGWDVLAPANFETLRYIIEASEPGGAQDLLEVTQRVQPAIPERTVQATLFRWEGEVRQPVERPADAIPGRGGVQVIAVPALTSLGGVRDWMRRYPYTCLEQKVSRAIALRDEQLWKEVTAALPSHLDGDGLLKYFPTIEQGSEVLTAYVLAISHEAGWALPAEVQGRIENGLQGFVNGTILRRSPLRAADLSIRKLAALEALARYGKVEPGLLTSITIEPHLWPTSAVLDWWGLLHHVPAIPDREKRLTEAEQIVRSRLNLQGTTMGFSTERGDDLWWLMVAPSTNAVRLILHLLQSKQWQEDLPRLMRGALGRQQRGAWDLTVTNAWGVLAVEKFSQTFEATPVAGATTATLAGATQQIEWAQAPQGTTLAFPWPAQKEDVVVNHVGTGNPWVTVRVRAAVPLTAPFSSGYRITRTVTPVEVRESGRWSRGD
ncbi:MAG: alpha-2-macroglobulin family protein, partial [Candidatus Binatia bacterium]